MGERKVLNKYFPPDFDPSKLPKAKRQRDNFMKVRMMMAMSVQCQTCGVFIYKGTKFNMRKEDVLGENYLGIQIFRFYFRCPKCAAEITFKTDPKGADYIVEHGATRTAEPFRQQAEAEEAYKREREEEEEGNAMKALENRTMDAKREMDLMADIEELRVIKARQEKLGTDAVLAALQRSAAEEAAQAAQAEEEDAELQDLLRQRAAYIRRLEEDISGEEEDEEGEGDEDGGPGPSVRKKPTLENALAPRNATAAPPRGGAALAGTAPPKAAVVVKVQPKVQVRAVGAAACPGGGGPKEATPAAGGLGLGLDYGSGSDSQDSQG